MRRAGSFAAAAFLASAAAADQASFESIVHRCAGALAQQSEEVAYLERTNVWVKRVRLPGEVAYDVRRTDSLVAPLAAHLELTYATYTAQAGSEAAAKAILVPLDAPTLTATRRINFAFRGGRWEVVDGMSLLLIGGTRTPAKLSRSEILAFKHPMASCLP